MRNAGSQAIASAIELAHRRRLGARVATLYTYSDLEVLGLNTFESAPKWGATWLRCPSLPCILIVCCYLYKVHIPLFHQSMTQHGSKNSDSTNSSTDSEFKKTAMVDGPFAFLHALAMTSRQGHLGSKMKRMLPSTSYSRCYQLKYIDKH